MKISAIEAAPSVSVIMATYKGAALVRETIDSVLAQTLTDFELIIVDDCSPDDTVKVLRHYMDPRIRIIESPVNQGPVLARNLAVSHARGRYIAALDQDDICLPDRFARQAEYLDAHRDVAVVASACDILKNGRVKPGKAPRKTTPGFLRWLLHVRNPLVWSSVMIRTDAAQRLEPFSRTEIQFAEDFDLYHRLAGLGRLACIDEVLTIYRCHDGGASKTQIDRMTANAWQILTDAHRPLFGEEAEQTAALVVRHCGAGEPAPDVATLDRLADVLDRLSAHFVQVNDDPESAALIHAEQARSWWQAALGGVRSGNIGMGAMMWHRPHFAGLLHAGPGRLLAAAIIGLARRIRARL